MNLTSKASLNVYEKKRSFKLQKFSRPTALDEVGKKNKKHCYVGAHENQLPIKKFKIKIMPSFSGCVCDKAFSTDGYKVLRQCYLT